MAEMQILQEQKSATGAGRPHRCLTKEGWAGREGQPEEVVEGRSQGKRRRVTRTPDTEPGKCVEGTWTRTRNRPVRPAA